ncbi:MAG TPA: Uma2 family endonuclease [Prosthecobacter sp.]
MRSWADICADKSLQDLPYKIETNRFDQIVMSPASFWHSGFQGDITALMLKLMQGGRVQPECPIQTTDGIKVPDVVWISADRLRPHRRAVTLPIAPEICVEVISPGNRQYEMVAKMQLYFAQGAQEVWLCDEEGNMQFFLHDSAEPTAQSRLCPEFPKRIEWAE